MQPLVKLEHITKNFSLRGKQKIHALSDVNLSIYQGETLGVVGESGCGKSTLARIIMGVYCPTQGRMFFEGKTVDFSSKKERRNFARNAQMIFQDPYSSLNPRMTVGQVICENLEIQGMLTPEQRDGRARELLEMVGLTGDYVTRFPNEFSGGQLQRVGIARALAVTPKFLVCDEPISALDLSIQSQVMNLLKKLKDQIGLTYLFIAHDLNMVRYLSDRIAVMYLGHIVEIANADALHRTPAHPYTRLLMDSILFPLPSEKIRMQQPSREEEKPQTAIYAGGCPFLDRCPEAEVICRESSPILREIGSEHFVACHKCSRTNKVE